MSHAPVHDSLADNVVAAAFAAHVRRLVLPYYLVNLFANNPALLLIECSRII
jgi:hypothetical protein